MAARPLGGILAALGRREQTKVNNTNQYKMTRMYTLYTPMVNTYYRKMQKEEDKLCIYIHQGVRGLVKEKRISHGSKGF